MEPRREEQCVRSSTRRRGGKAQSPQAVNSDRAAARAAELALELAGRRVIGIDPAVAEVADQDVAAEGPEGRRGKRHRPRGVELSSADEPLEQVAVRSEHVDESVTGLGGVILLSR